MTEQCLLPIEDRALEASKSLHSYTRLTNDVNLELPEAGTSDTFLNTCCVRDDLHAAHIARNSPNTTA